MRERERERQTDRQTDRQRQRDFCFSHQALFRLLLPPLLPPCLPSLNLSLPPLFLLFSLLLFLLFLDKSLPPFLSAFIICRFEGSPGRPGFFGISPCHCVSTPFSFSFPFSQYVPDLLSPVSPFLIVHVEKIFYSESVHPA